MPDAIASTDEAEVETLNDLGVRSGRARLAAFWFGEVLQCYGR